jgi:hypothetical protein
MMPYEEALRQVIIITMANSEKGGQIALEMVATIYGKDWEEARRDMANIIGVDDVCLINLFP